MSKANQIVMFNIHWDFFKVNLTYANNCKPEKNASVAGLM